MGELQAAAVTDRSSLTSLIREVVGGLIPNDLALATENHGGRLTTTATDPGLVEARVEAYDFWVQCVGDLPTSRYWFAGGTERAIRLSDLTDMRPYRRLALYQTFFRPFGVEHKLDLRLDISPTLSVDLGFSRKGSDFTDRERAIAAALHPYLLTLQRRIDSDTNSRLLTEAYGLSPREAQIVGLLASGRTNLGIAETLWLSPDTVRTHLERIYAKLRVRNRTEAALAAHRLLPDIGAGSDTATAALLGVTPRETAVLSLLRQGKSNAEIGEALGLTHSTVKRHLEHIYAKLDAKTRTEAVSRALTLGLG